MKQKLKVLVTGGTGYIGSFVVGSLIADGRFELVIAGRKRPECLDGQNFSFHRIDDISGNTDWKECLMGVDSVLHLAGIVSAEGVGPVNNDLFEQINVRGTEQLAVQAEEAGVRQFVLISSIKVNGDAGAEPFSAFDVAAPNDVYARSKRHAEERLKALCAGSYMAYTIIRPPLVYGPDAPGNFGLLYELVKKGIPLPLAGISNSRSFISVWNLSDLLKQCLLNEASQGETFVVRDGCDVSTPEFIELIGKACGCSARLFRVPLFLLKLCASLAGRQDAYDKLVGSLRVDDSHTRAVLQWAPPFTLQESLRMCFADNLSD